MVSLKAHDAMPSGRGLRTEDVAHVWDGAGAGKGRQSSSLSLLSLPLLLSLQLPLSDAAFERGPLSRRPGDCTAAAEPPVDVTARVAGPPARAASVDAGVPEVRPSATAWS